MGDPWTIPRTRVFPEVLELLEPRRDGVFCRHPKEWPNAYHPDWGFSRDQMIPLVAAMGVWGATNELRRLWNALPQDKVGGTKHTFNGEWRHAELFGLKVENVYFTGDIVGPMTTNLFRRAWNEDPIPAGDGNGPGGEAELWGNAFLRNELAKCDQDDTGDDLNLIVMLLTSALRFPSSGIRIEIPFIVRQLLEMELARQLLRITIGCQVGIPYGVQAVDTKGALDMYAKRPQSYGSYLGAYRQEHGIDMTISEEKMKERMRIGIASGWQPDVSPGYGAVRWYHRAESGGNPALAELYAPIIRKYLE